MTARKRPLWRCPSCGRTFVTRNMSHSCRRMSVATHLRDRPPEILALYRFLHDRIRQLGPVTVDPQGRGIVFQVRARAIGIAPKDRWIDLTLWLKSGREEDLDPALARLLAEAYAVAA